ncbi:MAG: hypothetical protein O2954_17625 [bacterium]|nr:hypothetical protein [bacterium]
MRLPQMFRIRQQFDAPRIDNIPETVRNPQTQPRANHQSRANRGHYRR